MNRIVIPTHTPYEVIIQRDVLARAGKLSSQIHGPCRAAIITDDIVGNLYADTVAHSFENAGYTVCRFAFSHGESSKTLQTFERILAFMADSSITRSDLLVALGGGVTGDLVGFSAASYLRGIDFIQIPTTFLAAIDSSVGGKTGVNLKTGKNLCGAFHQPRMVLIDCDTFDTLPAERFADGAAEAIKYGIIKDLSLFSRMKSGAVLEHIDEIVACCVKIKKDFVTEDEFDYGQRRLLNLGHTFGHAIERCSAYTITHGHAVAIGTLMATTAAWQLGLCAKSCISAVREALETNHLPTRTAFDTPELVSAMTNDKKRLGNSIGLILPVAIGQCVIHETPISTLSALVADIIEEY